MSSRRWFTLLIKLYRVAATFCNLQSKSGLARCDLTTAVSSLGLLLLEVSSACFLSPELVRDEDTRVTLELRSYPVLEFDLLPSPFPSSAFPCMRSERTLSEFCISFPRLSSRLLVEASLMALEREDSRTMREAKRAFWVGELLPQREWREERVR